MSLGDKIMKLYGDIIDMQWYDARTKGIRTSLEYCHFQLQD